MLHQGDRAPAVLAAQQGELQPVGPGQDLRQHAGEQLGRAVRVFPTVFDDRLALGSRERLAAEDQVPHGLLLDG